MSNAQIWIYRLNPRNVSQLSSMVTKWITPQQFPTKILGRPVAISANKTKNVASSKLEKKVLSALQRIDERPIRGEFNVWIWKNYLAHSLHFHLMVDLVKKDSITKIQEKVTKFIKKWLNLPKCCMLASGFHPNVSKLPLLPHCQELAKMLMNTAMELSKEAFIGECLALLVDPEFVSCNKKINFHTSSCHS